MKGFMLCSCFYPGTRVGDKYRCVVVKFREDAFLLAAYLTDTVERGLQRWPKNEE